MNKNSTHWFMRGLLLPMLLAIYVNSLHAQSITAGYGAPGSAINIANGPVTFTIQLVGDGAACAGPSNLSLTLPNGFTYVSGSAAVTSGTATLSELSSSGATAQLAVSDIEAAPVLTEITYQAIPTCGLIGTVETMEATYTLDACSGTVTVSSNAFNVQNAQLNITGVTNSSYGGAVGSTYPRAITISNDGYGTIDTIYLDDLVGIGFEIEGAVTSVGTLTMETIPEGTGTRYRYRVVTSLASGSAVTITETVRLGCAGSEYASAFEAWYGPGGIACPGIGDISTAGASATAAGIVPGLLVRMVPGIFTCVPATVYDTAYYTNTGTMDLTDLIINQNVSENGTYYTAPAVNTSWRRNIWMDPVTNPILVSTDGGTSWSAPTYTDIETFNTVGDAADGQLLGISLNAGTLPVGATLIALIPRHLEYDQNCDGSIFMGRPYSAGTRFNYDNGCSVVAGSTVAVATSVEYPYSSVTANPALAGVDVVAGVGFPVDFNLAGQVRYGQSYLADDGYVEFVVDLPPCIAAVTLGTGDVYIQDALGVMPAGMGAPYLDADNNIRIPYALPDAAGVPNAEVYFTGWKLHINSMLGDCSLCGPGSQSITVKTVLKQSVSCSDEFVIACNTAGGLTLHNCNTGICFGVANTFSNAERTNFGLADEDNNGIPDGTSLANANKLLFSNADTVAVRATGWLLGTYSFAYMSCTPSVSWVTPISGTARIYDASGTTTYTVTDIPVSGTYPNYMLDLSAAVLSGLPGGFQYEAGDSMNVSMIYKTQLDAAGLPQAATVQWRNALYASETEGGPAIACDTPFTAQAGFVLFNKDQYVYTSPTVNCGGVTDWALRYYNTVNGNVTPNGTFPYEVRRFSAPQWYGFVVPEGYVCAGARFANYAFTGYADKIVADSTSGDTLFFRVPDWINMVYNGNYVVDEGFDFRFHPILYPVCDLAAPSAVFHQVLITRDLFTGWQDVAFFRDATLLKGISENQIDIIPVNANVTTNTGTVEWEVLVRNTGNPARNVWLGKDAGISGVTITGVDYISAPGGSVISAVAQSGGVYQLSDYAPGANNFYRITATFTGCLSDTLQLAYGFKCVENYPATVADATCKESLTLSVTPRTANLQLAIVTQPTADPRDLCAIFDYELEVTNVGQGTASGIGSSVKWPGAGQMEYILGTYQVAYPIGSGYITLPDDSVAITSTGITFKVPFDTLSGTDKFRIKFTAATVACDFVSGSYPKFRAVGQNPCGSNIASIQSNGNQVNLTGAPTVFNAFSLSSEVAAVTACNNGGDITTAYKFSIINNGPDTTTAAYGYSISLPAPWVMDGTAVTYLHNPGGSAYTGTASGLYNFTTGILEPGDSVVLTVNLTAASSALACGLSDDPITEVATLQFSTTCVSNATVCESSKQILKTNATSFINVNRPAYTLTGLTAGQSSSCGTCMSGSVTLNHVSGSAYGAQDVNLDLYKDVDNSGTYTSGDILLGTQVYPIDNLDTYTLPFDVNTGLSGDVSPVVAVASIPCVCEVPQAVYTSNVVLPIRFTKTSAKATEGCAVALSWSYEATDIQVTGFEVMRSKDGRSYNKIETLPASANGYIDYVPQSGNWMYTIIAKGSDGIQVNSPVLTAVTSECNVAGLSVYPNPAKDKAEVILLSKDPSGAVYILTDVTGRTMLEGKLLPNVTSGLDLDKLASGTYTLRVVQSGTTYVQKVSIKK